MKKALCIILTMLLCASLFACDSGDTTTETTATITEENTVEITDAATETTAAITEENTVVATEKETDIQTEAKTDAQSTTNDSSYAGDEPALTCSNYEEYLALINDSVIPDNYAYHMDSDDLRIPDNFVYYDDISKIGEFRSFVFLSQPMSGKYDSYMYFLKIGGYDVTLYIDEKEMETFYESDRIIPEINSDNLTSADRSMVPNTTQGVFYFHNGIRYTYDIYGNLMSIKWYSDGFTFTLSALTDLIESGEYPLRGEQDFLSKLLNKQTAYDTAMGILDKDTAE